MSIITIRGLDPSVKAALQIRAAENGRSMEAEIREVLTERNEFQREVVFPS